jgi:hypothetical protein
MLKREGRGVGFAARADLAVEVGDVPLDRAHAQDQLIGDLLVALTVRHQPQHFHFTRGQPRQFRVPSVR